MKKRNGTINLPIARKQASIIERCIDKEKGAPSATHYEVIKQYNDTKPPYSVIKCKLETGRTHQIRVHMQAISHSLLGDSLYGSASELIDRQALHSYKIKFIHPITKEKVEYLAPLPQDIEKLM